MNLIKTKKFVLILILVLLGLTPILWFIGHPGQLINGVDTNFPLDPIKWFLRRQYAWTNIPNAGADFSSSTAGVFFHFIQIFFYTLTNDLQLTQISSMVFWFGAIVFTSLYFARTILPKSYISQLLFVIFYTFNTYIFNTWENVKVANLSLYVALPLGLVISNLWITKKENNKKLYLLTLLNGILLSGSGINPAYFIVFIFVIFLYYTTLALINKDIAVYKSMMYFLFIICTTNAFWIIPSAFFIITSLNGSLGLEQIGFANWIDSLSANTSLFNVLRIQGAWDWYTTINHTNTPLYIPYAYNYFYRLPFITFSLLLPILAFLSLRFPYKRLKTWYLFLPLMIIVGVFFGAGTHPPTGYLYDLIMKLPFLSFFRSPWYIFTPLVTFSYAALIALFYFRLTDKARYKKLFALRTIALVFCIANLIYCYPLVTGKIFRPEKDDSFYVRFPNYLFETQEWLNDNVNGRIVSYPPDKIEQFTWGYRGVESILTLFSDSEVITLPINNIYPNTTNIISNLYELYSKGEVVAATSVARKLGVSKIFEKVDQKSHMRKLPDTFKTHPIASFGAWNIFSFPGQYRDKVYATTLLHKVYPHEETPHVLGIIDDMSIAVDPNDSVVKQISDKLNTNSAIIGTNNGLTRKENNYYLSYNVEITTAGRLVPIIENYRTKDLIGEGSSLTVLLDNNKVKVNIEKVNDSFVYFEPIEFKAGKHILELPLSAKSILNKINFEVPIDIDSMRSNNADFKIVNEDSNRFLRIYNDSNIPAYLTLPIAKFDPHRDYEIHFRYRQFEGSLPQVLGTQWDDRGTFGFKEDTLPKTSEWKSHYLQFEASDVSGKMKFQLVSYESDVDNGSTTDFDDIDVVEYTPLSLILLQSSKATDEILVKTEMKSPVRYEAEVSNAKNPHVIVFSENYSPHWKAEFFNTDGKKINISNNHFMANGFANAWFVEGVIDSYRVKFYYWPQYLIIIGWFISLGTLVIIICKKD